MHRRAGRQVTAARIADDFVTRLRRETEMPMFMAVAMSIKTVTTT